jgi:N-acyl-phosphatidylethanolamine-hydrolysing phospholipase D
MRFLTSSVIIVAALLAGCATVNPYFDASKKHHRPDGFNNNYIDNWRPDQPSFLAWQRARWKDGLTPQDPTRVRVVSPDLA